MGFVEGQNLAFEYRAADNQEDRLAELVGDLVQRRVSVIVAPAGPSFVAAKAATTSIPIIFFTGFDPVSSGFVASLNRPGGNATGISVLHTEVVAKRLELLRELVPRAKSVAYLRSSTVGQLITFAFSPSSTSRRQLSNIASAKRPKSGRPGPQ
jgi:putative ABC transport system substrate-binding protein